ncbi:uncharacterized protein MEPE_01636 [Melanopsichium pennsylvanicum]|uniref:PWI domain-containing protein n=2 Tax=Melanopsichium pennsylvanicum TaxID=63383 RepID=A0AAJ4XIT3_9BASI|nr:pwi domain-containing protein [Melanopsichium pennsylvanicum 4]SNX82930.1 uncharacterized protein MEPE_01636 [Melanopsichium pennsylvanicum]
MGDTAYKGISVTQDSRFSNKESSLLRKLKFPLCFDTKIDTTKIQLSVIKPWIARRITQLLGFEDDVVLEYAAGMLEDQRWPDPRKVQIQLMGFLEDKTTEFMEELWRLLISAQQSPGGVPRQFVEEKKEELRKKREEAENVVKEAKERAARAAEAAAIQTTATQASGISSGGGKESRRKGSRWDTGAPDVASSSFSSSLNAVGQVERDDRRPPRYDGGSHGHQDYLRRDDMSTSSRDRHRPSEFLEIRSRDSGWGSRAPLPRNGDSWRPTTSCSSSRRSPSPAPRSQKRSSLSPSPSARAPRSTSRSRSRSVTPDYRDKIRKHRPSHLRQDAYERDSKRHHSRSDNTAKRRYVGEEAEKAISMRSSGHLDGRIWRKHVEDENEEMVEDAYERDAKRSSLRTEETLRTHKDQDQDADARKVSKRIREMEMEKERQKERELRDKLLRAKSSKRN